MLKGRQNCLSISVPPCLRSWDGGTGRKAERPMQRKKQKRPTSSKKSEDECKGARQRKNEWPKRRTKQGVASKSGNRTRILRGPILAAVYGIPKYTNSKLLAARSFSFIFFLGNIRERKNRLLAKPLRGAAAAASGLWQEGD